jgi:hypothetical protein
MIFWRDTLIKMMREVSAVVAVSHHRTSTIYWLEPGGSPVWPRLAEKMIEDGALIPEEDGLLPGASQTYRLDKDADRGVA